MNDTQAIDDARRLLGDAIKGQVFPAATVEVGDGTSSFWSEAFGTLTFDEKAPPTTVDTVFDLASLTKPLATTLVLMDLAARQRVALNERLADVFGEWRGPDRISVTVRDLLEHASGLPARLVDAPPLSRREFEHDICTTRLEYTPRTQAIYSDLGFILLGFLAEDRSASPFDQAFGRLVHRVDAASASATTRLLRFGVPHNWTATVAPTEALPEDLRRGRRLIGEVHDNYAAALGGVAGHAGLFGEVTAVGAFARALLNAARGADDFPAPLSSATTRLTLARSAVPGSSRALGWDTMLPTSSCGTRMSSSAFGHVGFTGTSLWVDPARNRYFVLLTNRACGGGTVDDMREVRRRFHDALGAL